MSLIHLDHHRILYFHMHVQSACSNLGNRFFFNKKNIGYGNFNMEVGYEKIISLISTVLQLLNLYYRDHRGLQVDPGQRLASIWPNWSVNWM